MARLRLLITLAAAAAVLSLGSPAGADCAAPSVEVSPRRVSPGEDLSITGRGWGDACNDTGGAGCDPPPLGDPIEDITVELRTPDGSRSVTSTTLDAGEDYMFEISAEVPDLAPGTYLVRASGGSTRATVQLRIESD